jgi:hypothetical protein
MCILEFYFKRTLHQTIRGELSVGFWADNKGDLKYKKQYNIYSFFIMFIPVFVITTLLIIIKENFC